MLAKLRAECGEFCFLRGLIIQAVLSVPAAYTHLDSFLRDYPGASAGEYIVYSLTQQNYFLVLFPFLCLIWTCRRTHETCRYPLLLRYRTGKELFWIRFLAKDLFVLAALAVHMAALCLVGRFLPAVPQMVFVSSIYLTGIIIAQFSNLFCYVCVMLLLYELLLDAAGNAMLGVMLAAAVSLLNLMAVKLMLQPVVMWTPWGHMAYWLFGQERPDYRFYGEYWLFLMVLMFYLEEKLNGRKDYVFEETRRVG